MECRVCFSSDPPLLTGLCQCRGSQGALHAACLRSWIQHSHKATCSVCLAPWDLPWIRRHPIVQPRAWHILGSPLFVSAHWITYIALYQLLPLATYMRIALWLQRAVFAIHVWSLAPPLVYWLPKRSYRRQWFQCLVYINSQYRCPLSPLCAALLSLWIPSLLILMYPYTQIWTFHSQFVEVASSWVEDDIQGAEE